ncbi:MAG: SDR family NAD(P)-dependent oxidoreductase [Planctomycetaceae bacterium]|jgi:NAD(P)-dependent dehydrogenase (short-subunit alcohol dehydrogenase family)|nr:SDR family NAD(P)-dependent oxidoreductase [Planctomycetaceae bacterium]
MLKNFLKLSPKIAVVIFVTIILIPILNLPRYNSTTVNAESDFTQTNHTTDTNTNSDTNKNLSDSAGRAVKVWFITGTSSGFGLEVTKALLLRGDFVAATALDPEVHFELQKRYKDKILPLRVDVTKRVEVEAAVREAVKFFGRIDVVLNNAGIGYWGAVEELSEEELRRQFDVNFFGSFRVIQAVLPVLQKQRGGHIIQISSIAGQAAFPLTGAYSSSKWAVEALNETVAIETAKFGIRVSIIEPGPFKTNFFRSIKYAENVMEKYSPNYDPSKATNQIDQKKITNKERIAELESVMNRAGDDVAAKPKNNAATEMLGGRISDDSGYDDPAKVVKVILKVADAKKPPLRVIVGKNAKELIEKIYKQRLKEWNEWE